jgi:hypothetical protein
MKEVYLIYASIPSILFDNKIGDFVKDKMKYKFHNNYYRGLYAWTTKKKILKEFLEVREGAKSMYTVIKREFSKNEFQEFKSENSYEELSYYTFYHDMDDDVTESDITDNRTFVCTKEEYEETYDMGMQYMYDYMAQIVNVDYLIFKDEFKMALDSIGYCDTFNRIYDGLSEYDDHDDFYFSRHEMTQFNNSYGLSYYGNEVVNICENKLVIFINIYYEMLVGYNPNNEIKLLIYR